MTWPPPPVYDRGCPLSLNPPKAHQGHTCRESCGVCGFLAPANWEEQTVGASSYTDFTRRNFDCGRFEGLQHLEEKKAAEAQQAGDDSDSEIDVFLSSDLIGTTCAATLVAD